MNLFTGLTTFAAGLALSMPAFAGDFYGFDSQTGTLYDIDSSNGTSTVAGTVTGGGPFGLGPIAIGANGKGYTAVSGFISGFSLYEIDMTTFVATQIWSPQVTSKADVGIAISPNGASVYVAGFVGLAFRVQLVEIDIATGTVTSHGDIPPGWGLAFDSAGDLYTTSQGAMWPELWRLDLTNLANSVQVGPLVNVDYTRGLDLSSDQGTGAIHAYSRQLDSIYSVDGSSGSTALVSAMTGTVGMFWLTEIPCQQVAYYGDACVGTGGFFPRLTIGGCPEANATITLDVTNGLGGSAGAIFLGTSRTSIPLGNGCDLLISPILPFTVPANLGGAGAGNGSVSIAAPIPSFMPSGSVTLQGIYLDAGSVGGFVTTNGAEITFE